MTNLVLQRLVLPLAVETAGLYWRHEGHERPARLSANIKDGGALDLDTYFNAFDENVWRRHTRLTVLSLELHIVGAAHVELWRHSRAAPPALIAEANGLGGRLRLDVPSPPHPRAAGRLALRVTAESAAGATLLGGHWCTGEKPQAVRLMPVICTFDRDAHLAAMLAQLAADHDTLAAIEGIIVVNNGPPGLPQRLRRHAGVAPLRDKLHVIEQGNVGGAGGFTRGLLEARACGATHAILMDDDVQIEPEAVLRTVRLYQLARQDMAIAGHMLDLFRPTHLYEAGAQLDDRRLATVPLHLGVEMSQPGALDRFLEESPMHYNGWWFMGLPLRVLDRIGYPMPCFIRGDDVEFGRRLHDAGVALVSTPGIGIWHEPFYAKLGSWHAYYEFRNMFVLAACHLPRPERRLVRAACKWVVAELLMFRYQRAALLMRGVEDFLAGPAIYARDPREVHASVTTLRHVWPTGSQPRDLVTQRLLPLEGPRSRVGVAVQVTRALWTEWWRRDSGGSVIAVAPRDHIWFRVRGADAVVVYEPWEVDHPVYRRSRTAFRTLAGQAARMVWRMRHLRAVVTEWRQAHGVFTSEEAWRTYLGCEDCADTASAPVSLPRTKMAGVDQL